MNIVLFSNQRVTKAVMKATLLTSLLLTHKVTMRNNRILMFLKIIFKINYKFK